MPIPIGVLAQAGASSASATDFDFLESTTLSSTTSTVTFSNLSSYSNYKHLQIRGTARASATGSPKQFRVRFNGDTTSNYWSHWMEGVGLTPNAGSSGATTTAMYLGTIPGNTGNTSYGGFVIDLLDFNNANKSKTIRFYTGPTNSDNSAVFFGSGFHLTMGATTSISLIATFDSTTFASGSKFSLYGVK